MRTLGIDHGDTWIGLAISDPSGTIATPMEVIEGEPELMRRLPEIVADREVHRVVIGLPLNMDGTVGPKARQVLAFRDRVVALLEAGSQGIEVEVFDERLTTVEAERYLAESGLSSRKRKRRVDMVAAQILLRSYLESSSS